MDVVEREQLDSAVISNHWYYEAKFALLEKHVRSLPLALDSFTSADVGSGLGLFLHKMEKVGLASPGRSIGVDPAYDSPQKAFQSEIIIHPGFPELEVFDLLMLMDVLEHVEDDLALLKNTLRRASHNGFVLITVPALPVLWSAHDRFLGHFRRYTLASLERLILATGQLEMIELHYYFACILPAAVPVRLLRARAESPMNSDMSAVPAALNSLLTRYCKMELGVAKLNQRAGLTAVALCKLK
ncbi:MAG TPA: methyltransferase domain-containing protein [Chthoniobacterales bacterium]|jgi:2-polyprenyl-3-methyl-5-hydroxy-6-metoxy-1,4-benzoquinol methylase